MPGPVVITGGGTGGHVFPMAAIAEALTARGLRPSDLRYVGSRRGQEAVLLAGDVPRTLLPGRGLRRSFAPADLARNVAAGAGLVAALVYALYGVRKWRTSVVVSVGGYASFAASFAAWCWRVPLVLVEFDAVPGAAQRRFATYAVARCHAFASDDEGGVFTGAPLRDAIETLDRTATARGAARAAMAPPIEPGRRVVVVMTGSLGATRVNRVVAELAARWRDRDDLTLVHVAGRRDYEELRTARVDGGALDYRLVAFGDMVQLWGVADLAVCRAGAMTIAELTALAIPSVLVPLPGAPGDHQSANAESVARAGGARVLADRDLTVGSLGALIDDVLNPSTLEAMSHAAGALGRRGAAAAIADVVLAVRAS